MSSKGTVKGQSYSILSLLSIIPTLMGGGQQPYNHDTKNKNPFHQFLYIYCVKICFCDYLSLFSFKSPHFHAISCANNNQNEASLKCQKSYTQYFPCLERSTTILLSVLNGPMLRVGGGSESVQQNDWGYEINIFLLGTSALLNHSIITFYPLRGRPKLHYVTDSGIWLLRGEGVYY